jgi:LmbE family N-acetylglucosaminyl deacetylase
MPNYYVDISRYVDVKIEAFRCYETEKRAYPHPRSEEALKVLSQKRGIEIGFRSAEAFMILRDKWE